MKSWKLLLVIVLYVSIISVAVRIVMNRHEARNLFSELQRLEKERDVQTALWSRLILEEGTQLNQVVVEKRAKKEIHMRVPRQAEIKVLLE